MSIQNSILQANDLSLGYKKGKKSNIVAEQISFSLKKGKLTCLLGPNGVGKSTLIKTIMGQVPALKNQVYLDNKPTDLFSIKDLAKKIAVVLTEKISSGNLTVEEIVSLGRIPHTGWSGYLSENDREKVSQAIRSTHINYIQDRPLSELSDGQLQKVMIARALAQDGEILILDEPTAHLDLINRFEIMHLLRDIAKNENKAVLVVTHDLDIAIDTADEFWLMQCGMPLVCGSPEDLILQGSIDLLLPNETLKFDISVGKVQESTIFRYPQIDGPEETVKWVKSALRKNKINQQGKSISIEKDGNQISYILKTNTEIIRFESISSLISQLNYFENDISMPS
ncbi:ABC transporter ATP-binding protein [Aquiflexum gelatinilyticum]|uniref:ABC transporter ATP-binding protein n=1 Tax=Aquiflexum gelatinilyticum TaxID=2961943 RepID=UPI002167091D|nr:ABC transporter ATP-binding protein [Aquiflexum gelatinilyticum]MCS4434142.1 ABC transporter ATP-binding protein [Aquiflexum gelatinilyticum]